MIFYEVSDEFAVAFYRWACADFRREIEQGFPFLRGIEGHTTYSLLSLMESLPKADRFCLASGLLKRFHTRAVEILGEEKSSPAYHRLFELLSNSFGLMNPLFRERAEHAPDLGPSLEQKDRRRIVTAIKEELHEPSYVWPNTGPWKGTSFEVEIGRFQILTRIYIGMNADLCYEHAILKKDTGTCSYLERVYCDGVSIYSWLGISSQTMWTGLRMREVDRVAGDLIRLCRHFIEGVGGLLDDSYVTAGP